MPQIIVSIPIGTIPGKQTESFLSNLERWIRDQLLVYNPGGPVQVDIEYNY
jgi:hypothetical protein